MSTSKLQRNTRQRQVIMRELNKLTSHPTAAELYEIVRNRMPKISLGTIYRNLELLAQGGMIQKLNTSGREVRFDGNPDRHCHVCCVCCGRVEDAHEVPTELLHTKIKSLKGYELIGHRLEFIGICPQCKRKQAMKKEKGNQPD